MEIITKYFPDLSEKQVKQFYKLQELYSYWNSRINLISRKDFDNLYERHVLHSLAIAKTITFPKDSNILDVGTGGGFPGIPLAILYPEANFLLIDGVLKKIKVAQNISQEIVLENVKTEQIRVENLKEKYDYIVSRAVTTLLTFYRLVVKNINTNFPTALNGGIYYLKGGDLSHEKKELPVKVIESPISEFYDEEFFKTKKIIFIPSKCPN